MVVSRDFVPRIPATTRVVAPVPPPFALRQGPPAEVSEKPETLFSWAFSSLKMGMRALPRTGGQLVLQLGIVLAVNLVLWPLKTFTLPKPIASLVSLAILLTATYNNVVPKTIYWVIVFTFGKRLLSRVKSEGFARAMAPVVGVVPEFRRAQAILKRRAQPLLLLGTGIGLAIANNFASYSRFPDARNKSDKYLVALVISFTVSYLLGERSGGLFKFVRLASSDINRVMGRPGGFTDDHTFVLLTGFVAGLLLDAPLVVLGVKYGGYMLGALCIAASLMSPSRET